MTLVPKSNLMKVLVVLLIIVLVVGGLFVFQKSASKKALASNESLPFITSSPVDLNQITRISKFRSCSGHDFSGSNDLTGSEPASSMKHYVTPDQTFTTSTEVKLLAPFDGTIDDIGKPEEGTRGVFISLRPTIDQAYLFEFGHVAPLATLKAGDAVKSGDLIGYDDMTGAPGAAFDLELGYHKGLFSKYTQNLDSLFNHLSPTVAQQFAAQNFTKEAMFFTKEYRTANPCQLSGVVDKGDQRFTSDATIDTVVSKRAPAASVQATGGSASTDASKTPATGAKDSPAKSSNNEACAASVPVANRPPGCK